MSQKRINVPDEILNRISIKNVKDEKAIGEISNGYLFSSVSAQEIKSKYHLFY